MARVDWTAHDAGLAAHVRLKNNRWSPEDPLIPPCRKRLERPGDYPEEAL